MIARRLLLNSKRENMKKPLIICTTGSRTYDIYVDDSSIFEETLNEIINAKYSSLLWNSSSQGYYFNWNNVNNLLKKLILINNEYDIYSVLDPSDTISVSGTYGWKNGLSIGGTLTINFSNLAGLILSVRKGNEDSILGISSSYTITYHPYTGSKYDIDS